MLFKYHMLDVIILFTCGKSKQPIEHRPTFLNSVAVGFDDGTRINHYIMAKDCKDKIIAFGEVVHCLELEWAHYASAGTTEGLAIICPGHFLC